MTKYYYLYRFGYWVSISLGNDQYYFIFYSYTPIYSINGNVARFSHDLNRAHVGYDLGRKWATINWFGRKWVNFAPQKRYYFPGLDRIRTLTSDRSNTQNRPYRLSTVHDVTQNDNNNDDTRFLNTMGV